MSGDSEADVSPAELAVQIDSSLKSLLIRVGQSLRARTRLQTTLRLLQDKAASSTLQSREELILLQQYHRGRDHTIPGIKAIERECIRYDGLVKQLAGWVGPAKDALELELVKAKAREETERLENEQKAIKSQQEEIEKEAKRAADVPNEVKESIVIDDDEDEDDVPLASRTTTEQPKGAIDLTDDSPTVKQASTLPALTSTMTDPTSLLASLSGFQNSNDNSTSMALDNFDFSQLGLQNDYTSTMQNNDLPMESSLDFNMDFLDYNAMGGGEGTVDNDNLFGNIDFSALLAGSSDISKKEP
jgi:hypothetical protein